MAERLARKPMTIRAFAKAVGVSHPTVIEAIRKGRLTVGVEAGRIVDAQAAAQQWVEGTDRTRTRPEAKARAEALRGELEGSTTGPTPRRPVLPPAGGPASGLDGEGEDLEGFRLELGMGLADAAAAEKVLKAKRERLKLRQELGELVEAREVEARLVAVFRACRAKLLSLPARVRQALPQLTLEDVATIEDAVREALTDLAEGAAE